jgi:hypothetical protein
VRSSESQLRLLRGGLATEAVDGLRRGLPLLVCTRLKLLMQLQRQHGQHPQLSKLLLLLVVVFYNASGSLVLLENKKP